MHAVASVRTLTLEILLEALEAYIAGSAEDENAKYGLDVGAETSFLTEKEQRRFDERPQNGHGDKEEPEEENAALEMDRDGRTVAASERLRAEGVECSRAAEGDAPSWGGIRRSG